MGGPPPDYYEVIVAARYLRVPPWDLAGIPETAGCYAWVVWALVCQSAQASAQAQIAKQR